MPIDIEAFEAGTEPSGAPKNVTRPKVVQFLKENSDTAYTNKEIAEALGLVPATVSHAIGKLQKEGKVAKRMVEGRVYIKWVGGDDEE